MNRLRARLPIKWRRLFPTETNTPASAQWSALFPALHADDAGELWTQLAQAVDTRQEKPNARRDVAVESIGAGKGVIISDADRGVYVQLASEDFFLWERMDGTRTQIDLAVDYCMHFKALAPMRVTSLVESLRSQGLLTARADEVFNKLSERLLRSTPMGRINDLFQTVLQREFAIGGVDGLVTRLYRAGIWVFYTRPLQILFWLIALTGLIAFGALALSGRFSILGEGSLVEGAITLFIFETIALLLHESAHAFTVKAFGRRVRRAGVFIMMGLIGAFVDTTDMWPAGRRAQLWVTWAGPFMNAILGGAAALLIVLDPASTIAALAFQFAVSQYALVILNLTPFLRLDGYYLLSDWLEVPNLRMRSFVFIQRGFTVKLKHAWSEGRMLPKLSRDEKILTIFGALSMFWLANILIFAILTAPVRLIDVFSSMFSGTFSFSDPLSFIFFAVGLLFTVLLLIRMVGMLRSLVRNQVRGLAQAPAWRVALVCTIFVLLVSAIPDLLAGRTNPRVSLLYARSIALGSNALVLWYAWRLSNELRGARLQLVLRGAFVSGIVLTTVTLIALLVDLAPETFSFLALPFSVLRVLAFVPLLGGMLLSLKIVLRLIGAALGWMVLMLLGAIGAFTLAAFIPAGVTQLPTMIGYTLFAAALLLHAQLAHRPLVAQRVELQIKGDDPAQILSQAVAAVMAEMLQAVTELSGKPARLQLATDFNTYAANADWPMWITMKGQVGDQTKGIVDERASIYRVALDDVRGRIAALLGATFAEDAHARAVAELPLAAQIVFQRWIFKVEDALPPIDDRVRVRLAGRRLAETLLIGCAKVYGWALTNTALGAFNRMAAAAGWPFYLRGNGRLADDLRGDLLDIARVYGEALQDLLGRIAGIAGVTFVERGVLQVYDSLPWETREVAGSLLFDRLSWARRLPKTQQEEPRDTFLRSVPLLGWMTPDDLNRLAEGLKSKKIKAGRTAIARDRYLDHALIVRHGNLQAMTIGNGVRRVVEQIGPGGIIGVRSIVNAQPAPYEYIAQTDSELWLIAASSVKTQLNPFLHLQDALDEEGATLALLARIPLFATLSVIQRRELAHKFELLRLPRGSSVLRQGEASQGFFIVRHGELDVLARGQDDAERHVTTLGPGEFFGESALLEHSDVTASVRARSDVELLRLEPAEFHALLSAGLAAPLAQVHSRRTKERGRVTQMIAVEGRAL